MLFLLLGGHVAGLEVQLPLAATLNATPFWSGCVCLINIKSQLGDAHVQHVSTNQKIQKKKKTAGYEIQRYWQVVLAQGGYDHIQPNAAGLFLLFN